MTALPPTTHALPQTHRVHLVKSTRKLGALLGETPLLVDPLHSRSSSVSSTASIQSITPPLRTSSLAAADPAPVRHAPRPLLLLRLASPRPASLLVSPVSPGFQISPITPTFVVDRRKKMAKLARTLGTNVPPELVFSAAPKSNLPSPAVVPAMLSALSPAHEPRRRMSSSSASTTSSALASPTREATYAYYNATSDDEWVDLGPSSYPPSPRSPHYAKAAPTWTADFADDTRVSGRSSSPPPRPSTSSRSTDDTRYLSRHYEFSAPARSNSPHPSSRSASPDENDDHATYRKEQGWSGEWSGARGMDDVVKSLRGLRIK
ncbi:hypothetical protein C8R45DRAFT_957790 [Mycena sanguinolenta]|nr:hypothetical protein C8R45DRAFT_957790 [Mycena sanguinolenta]